MARGTKRAKRYFGNVRKLPSGRFQARYTGPDGLTHCARTPEGRPLTFETGGDADAWLSDRHSEIIRNAWRPPAETTAPLKFGTYAATWMAQRELKATTRRDYERLLREYILPRFGDLPLKAIEPAAVRAWHADVAKGRSTTKAHAYGLLRTICATAVTDEVISANPCRIRGAGSAKRQRKIKPATLAELETVAVTIPGRYQLLVLLAAWCALRFGELTELRRHDVDVKGQRLQIRRGVTHPDGRCVIGDPKSDAGKRDVAIPPHLIPLVKAHLGEYAAASQNGLLFPPRNGGCHLQGSALYKVYRPARAAAGRPDLRFHDLRHTGAVLAAATGATLAELMARLGHSTPAAALIYQHAAADRDSVIAAALSKLATTKPAEERTVTSRQAAPQAGSR